MGFFHNQGLSPSRYHMSFELLSPLFAQESHYRIYYNTLVSELICFLLFFSSFAIHMSVEIVYTGI